MKRRFAAIRRGGTSESSSALRSAGLPSSVSARNALSQEAGANERYVREWLGGMVASRIVERDPEGYTHRLPPEHAHWLSRKNPTANMAVFAQYVSVLGNVEDKILHCFKQGGGVPYSELPRFHER